MNALHILFLLSCAAASPAEIVDTIVGVVEGRAIKHSDVLQEIRLSALVNREEADLSTPKQKEAANRLIDQALIRHELANGFPVSPEAETVEVLLGGVREAWGGEENLRQALASHQLTQADLQKHLEWQATVLQFVRLRFGKGELRNGAGGPANSVNSEFFAWLDEMRKQKQILLREERLR